MSGVKISLTDVLAAEGVVRDAVSQMEGLTQKILAQAGLSTAAMKAPAGQITASTFDGLGGAGKALHETLSELQADLAKLRATAQSGSDQATQAAKAGAGSSVAQGM